MTEIDDFYELIGELRARCGGERLLASSAGRMPWPNRGVYFFFEPGEVRSNGEPRVVRIGTHALTAGSKTTLWKRLSQHRGSIGGSHPGGGNHRGSIFRLHVGQCLLARDGDVNGVADSWGDKSSAARVVRQQEYAHEVAVSRYIGRMPFLWLPVLDEPGSESERGFIESGLIALLSNASTDVTDPPTEQWLGRWSTRESVRESGLWNVRHVGDTQKDVLPVVERHISCG